MKEFKKTIDFLKQILVPNMFEVMGSEPPITNRKMTRIRYVHCT